MNPEEYENKRQDLNEEFKNNVSKIKEKYNLRGVTLSDTPKANEPENLKNARIEYSNSQRDYINKENKLVDEFQKSFVEIITESDRNKQEVNRLSKELSKSKTIGGKKMEQKDEQEIENLIDKILKKHEKSNKYESAMDDIHSKISKIDTVEKNLVDIIPKVNKIDSICEDGKCFKDKLEIIEKDLAETKKGRIKAGICDNCGEPAVMYSDSFLASHCSNCGYEIPGWEKDDGTPVTGWKSYKLRNKK